MRPRATAVTPGEGILEGDSPDRNDVTLTCSQGEEMVDTGTLERHTGPSRVTGRSARNTQGRLVGEIFTKETGEKFDVERIKT